MRKKGRRGHIQETIKFSAGGGEEGFVFKRSDGTITDTSTLSERDRQILEFLRRAGSEGVRYKALLEYMSGKKSTLSDSANRLIEANLVRRANGRYYAKVPTEPQNRDATPKTGGSERFGGGSAEPAEPSGGLGSVGSVFLGTEPTEPALPGSKNGSVVELQPDNPSSSSAARSGPPGGASRCDQNDVGGYASRRDDGGRLTDEEVERVKELKREFERLGLGGAIATAKAREQVLSERGSQGFSVL